MTFFNRWSLRSLEQLVIGMAAAVFIIFTQLAEEFPMFKHSHTHSNIVISIALILVAGVAASAQIGGLGGITKKLKKQAPVPNVLGGDTPITTSLPDGSGATCQRTALRRETRSAHS